MKNYENADNPLFEFSNATIHAELARRKGQRAWGLCDACGDTLQMAPVCNYPIRHNASVSQLGRPRRRFRIVSRRGLCYGLLHRHSSLAGPSPITGKWRVRIFAKPFTREAVMHRLAVEKAHPDVFGADVDPRHWDTFTDAVQAVYAAHELTAEVSA